MPRVAALLPIYDAGTGLARVLEAVRAEMGPTARILVVDDGSTDGSREVLARLAPGLDLEVVEGPGRGLSAALNHGLGLLDADLVAQIDQDVEVERVRRRGGGRKSVENKRRR